MKSLLEMTEEEIDSLSEDEFVENFLKLSEDDQEKMFEKFPELKSLLDDDEDADGRGPGSLGDARRRHAVQPQGLRWRLHNSFSQTLRGSQPVLL